MAGGNGQKEREDGLNEKPGYLQGLTTEAENPDASLAELQELYENLHEHTKRYAGHFNTSPTTVHTAGSPRGRQARSDENSVGESLEETADDKKKKLTKQQVVELETMFQGGYTGAPEGRGAISKQMGITERQVAIWFQNRRARQRSKELSQDFEMLKKDFRMVFLENQILRRELTELRAQVQPSAERDPSSALPPTNFATPPPFNPALNFTGNPAVDSAVNLAGNPAGNPAGNFAGNFAGNPAVNHAVNPAVYTGGNSGYQLEPSYHDPLHRNPQNAVDLGNLASHGQRPSGHEQLSQAHADLLPRVKRRKNNQSEAGPVAGANANVGLLQGNGLEAAAFSGRPPGGLLESMVATANAQAAEQRQLGALQAGYQEWRGEDISASRGMLPEGLSNGLETLDIEARMRTQQLRHDAYRAFLEASGNADLVFGDSQNDRLLSNVGLNGWRT